MANKPEMPLGLIRFNFAILMTVIAYATLTGTYIFYKGIYLSATKENYPFFTSPEFIYFLFMNVAVAVATFSFTRVWKYKRSFYG